MQHKLIETFKTDEGIFSIDSILDHQIANRLRTGKNHQSEAIAILSSFLSPGDVVIDAGAHIGTFSVPLALRGMKIIAFEPSHDANILLQENATQNDIAIDIRKKGLGEKKSQAKLLEGERGNAGSRSLEVGEGGIEVTPLDNEVQQVKAIKMDVEGMELSVLKGAKRLLSASRPVLLFETNLTQMRAQGASTSAIQKLLQRERYNLYILLQKDALLELGKLASLSLAAFCIAPGTKLFGRTSYPFDVLAVPQELDMPLPYRSVFYTHLYLVWKKFVDIFNRYLNLNRFRN